MRTLELTDKGSELVERTRARSRLPAPEERRRIREAAGASFRDIGRAVGVNAMTVLRWERGEARPRPDHAAAYAVLLEQLEQAAQS